MAELTVKIDYKPPARTALLTALKVTFPFWGVLGPIAALIAFIAFVTILNQLAHAYAWNPGDLATVQLPRAIGIMVGGLAIPAALLLLTQSLTHECITADKEGIRTPWFIGRSNVPWSSVRRISVDPPIAGPDPRQQSLVIYTDRAPIKLALANMTDAETEQLLLAIDMWAENCDRDPSVASLQESIRQIAPQSSDLSYTNMWEEELRRRFTAAAFIPLEPGTHVRGGSLKVVRQLALGGLSALYLCQLDEKTLVVLKEAVVPEDSIESVRAKALEMFEREAKLLMKLEHKNIVKVMDCFTDGGRSYLMLEYINGQDIRQFVKQNGAQKDHVVVEWAIQIASILKYLHEQDPPIMHRDLTPDNLVVRNDGSVVLIDFGAANELIGTSTGTFVGKQSFIAPEQFRGKAVTQSDIYAFGCTLYFMLTGEDPEALSTSAPKDVVATVNDELNELVVCCTQMEPSERYHSAAQMIPVLRKIAAGMLVS